MLSFATEFPVDHAHDRQEFIDVVRRWVLDSPHAKLVEDDFHGCGVEGRFAARRENQALEVTAAVTPDEEMVAVKMTQSDHELEWSTEAVFSRRVEDTWVGVRTSRESNQPAVRLPPAKKPILVKSLLENLGGGKDGLLAVSSAPHALSNNDIDTAARLMLGQADCRLPVVYVSASFSGKSLVDVEWLARGLSGMAHVVVEPNRPFSRRLQIDVESQNVYGGAIGIYWPEASGRRSFFMDSPFTGSEDLATAITDEVRAALLNRRPLYRCTKGAVDEAVSGLAYAQLKASGSQELLSYVASFDTEIRAKTDRLEDAEREIARLTRELRGYESKASAAAATGLALRTAEQSFFPNEISDVVISALSDARSRLQADSRRIHIISSILDANAETKQLDRRREELKKILRDYTSMTKEIRHQLEDLGFTITDDGKHYKLIYEGDERYTFALAKTGSDRRGGLNSASDISKRVF
jgi:hypothetical protein